MVGTGYEVRPPSKQNIRCLMNRRHWPRGARTKDAPPVQRKDEERPFILLQSRYCPRLFGIRSIYVVSVDI